MYGTVRSDSVINDLPWPEHLSWPYYQPHSRQIHLVVSVNPSVWVCRTYNCAPPQRYRATLLTPVHCVPIKHIVHHGAQGRQCSVVSLSGRVTPRSMSADTVPVQSLCVFVSYSSDVCSQSHTVVDHF